MSLVVGIIGGSPIVGDWDEEKDILQSPLMLMIQPDLTEEQVRDVNAGQNPGGKINYRIQFIAPVGNAEMILRPFFDVLPDISGFSMKAVVILQRKAIVQEVGMDLISMYMEAREKIYGIPDIMGSGKSPVKM